MTFVPKPGVILNFVRAAKRTIPSLCCFDTPRFQKLFKFTLKNTSLNTIVRLLMEKEVFFFSLI